METHGPLPPAMGAHGSEVAQRVARVLRLEESPVARALAELLAGLDDEHRRAVLALATDPALQAGVMRAGLAFWPNALPRPGDLGAQASASGA